MPRKAYAPPNAEIKAIEQYDCPHCRAASESYKVAANGPHIAAYCIRCGRFVKFLPKGGTRVVSGSRPQQKPVNGLIHGYIVTATKRVGMGLNTAVLGIADRADDVALRDYWRERLPDARIGMDYLESLAAVKR